ncbi:hypothetical protein DMUE_0280 [Dictyocoela muelleri]|nr:hypothetical protein DMUE_0280 [Dictyocoela muelleri]
MNFLPLKMRINLTDKIIKSIRGRDKIGYESYFYNYMYTDSGKKIWRCNKRGCPSILKTNIGNELLELSTHNHLKDEVKFFKTLLKQKISERALSTNESSRDVVLKVIKDNKSMKVPLDFSKLNTFVNKERKINNFSIIEDYDIPEELQITNENKQFLFLDSGKEDENRVLIFTTDENIVHLENSNILICDGTFKSSPSCFEQIFTIQVKLREMYLPLMYCFMKNKKEVSYDKIFKWIKEKNSFIVLSIKSIVIDFEIASYNALKRYFTNSNLYGCNFHLGQIVWRRIQSLKFSKSVIDNFNIKLQVKMMLALSFVPSSEVYIVAARLKTFIIQQKCEDMLALFEWFQAEYLSTETGNKTVSFWNVYERTRSNIPRTTNSLEGYHRHLNTFINTKQSSIIPILNELKNEQIIIENRIFMSLYKEPTINEDPVKKLIESYQKLNDLEYLKHIGLNFNWKLD